MRETHHPKFEENCGVLIRRVLNALSGNPLTESSTDGVIGEPGYLPEIVVKEHINVQVCQDIQTY